MNSTNPSARAETSAPSRQRTRVIVDDEQRGREPLSGILKRHFPKLREVGQAVSVDESVALASLKVFDVLGREVLDATGRLGGGTSVVLHHRDLPSRGMYFVRMQDNTGIITTAIAR